MKGGELPLLRVGCFWCDAGMREAGRRQPACILPDWLGGPWGEVALPHSSSPGPSRRPCSPAQAGLLVPGGPLALLDLLPLTLSCGEECSVDGVHSQPEVYDAALQLLLSLDALGAAQGTADSKAQRRQDGHS